MCRRRHLTAALVASALVLLVGAPAWAAPTVTLGEPKATGVIDTFTVTATVTDPTFVISSVVADGDGTAPKSLTAGASNVWSGVLDVSQLPIGPFTLAVTATNANGESAKVTKSLLHSHRPTLTAVFASQSVVGAKPTLHATCAPTDGYPCAKIEVIDAALTPAKVLATANGATMSQIVDLSAYEGQQLTLTFKATDTAGVESTPASFGAYVESSPNLVMVDAIGGSDYAAILDFDATRILYLGSHDKRVKDRTTGVTTVVDASWGGPAFLFSGGVVLPTGTWRGSAFTPRGTYQGDIAVNGDWVVWWDGEKILRENLVTGVIEQRGTAEDPAYNAPYWHPKVSIDDAGNVAYLKTSQLSSATMMFVPTAGGAPVSLGQNVWPMVSGKLVLMSYGTDARAPYLFNGTSYEMLDVSGNKDRARPGIDYRITNGGWVAYTKSVAGHLQVRTRSPAGADALASPYNDVTLAGLNEQGEVTVDHKTGRSLSKPGQPALPIGGTTGRMVAVGGDWYAVKGRALLKVSPGNGPPAGGGLDGGAGGGGDAGAPDSGAGSSPSSSDGGAGGSSGSGASASSGAAAAPSDGADPEGGGETTASSCAASASRPRGVGVGAIAAIGVAIALVRRRRRA